MDEKNLLYRPRPPVPNKASIIPTHHRGIIVIIRPSRLSSGRDTVGARPADARSDTDAPPLDIKLPRHATPRHATTTAPSFLTSPPS
jgi:hypothetical protein